MESPSHLRTHPAALRLTRRWPRCCTSGEREITDTPVDLLIATVHRISTRAEHKVSAVLVSAFKRVGGKETSCPRSRRRHWPTPMTGAPGVVSGGKQALPELVHEFTTKGPVYRRTVATTLKPSYTTTTGAA